MWPAVEEPGPEVTAVRDQLGVRWRRDAGLWWGNIGHGYEDHRTWLDILGRGPLIDATND
jgi:hypothetical protein